MILGSDREYVKDLKWFKNLHARVSLKGCNEDEFHRLTGAQRSAYELTFEALRSLIAEGVSCNACLSVLFSSKETIREAKEKLFAIRPGLLRSLEIETITLFPKVRERLIDHSLIATDQPGMVRSKLTEINRLINFEEGAF